MTKATKSASKEERAYPFTVPVSKLTPEMKALMRPREDFACDHHILRHEEKVDGTVITRMPAPADQLWNAMNGLTAGDFKIPARVTLTIEGCEEHGASWIQLSMKAGTLGGAGWNIAPMAKVESRLEPRLAELKEAAKRYNLF